ncbi:hypothetical protein N7449_006175 [Penicillium cf. viridicatum]|uniref:C2H2-type domain-containing protein n=1 Tax=Penicillium cf. viridicatum TaxID=2972119 RepID=A0A9W9JGN1_9EURO|nr:hypothetical protein N7449_006175 [Penicillium cf. viridicatum]
MESESDPSTSSLIALCIRDFHTLLDSIPDEQNEIRLKIQDDMGMLRVWVGNFGAHRKHTDRLSLDHRLREAPDLHREVQNHIRDITEAIQGAISFFSGSEESLGFDNASDGSEMHELDADDSDSDGFWDQVKAESGEYSKLDEYMLDIQYTITSLYKFSLTLQNPAHRDRTAQASRIGLGHFEFYDIQHVSDKYNIPRDSTLAQRLGKANTRRRQLLAYHKDHTEKISRYVDVAVQKAIEAPRASIKDTGTRSISTKWTQDTIASTIYHQDNDGGSDSGQTKFSATTSTAGDQAYVLMPPPPPADVVNIIQSKPFFCPYCRQTIQLEDMEEDWKYHVYSDLRPYICTFGDCVKANQLYDSYTEWSEHERQFHRREWICNLCSFNFKSESLFRNHLRDAHAGVLPEDQHQAMVKLSERSTSSAQQCPLCTKLPISNPIRFQQHLARHLQQLSLFVLPRPGSEENEHATRDGESNESQQVVVIDDESITSSKSISINQRSAVMEGGQTSSEGSESDDQLEVPEAENHPVTQDQVDKKIQEIENNKMTLGPEHPSTLDHAEKLAREVLTTYQASFGTNHPLILSSMESLASIYERQGRWSDAEDLAKEVVRTSELVNGRTHPETLRFMCHLGYTIRIQGRLQEAKDLGEKVLREMTKAGMDRHVYMLLATVDLAVTHEMLKLLPEAGALASRALRLMEETIGKDHSATIYAMATLNLINESQNKADAAKELGETVHANRERKLGKDHPDTVRALEDLRSVSHRDGPGGLPHVGALEDELETESKKYKKACR